MAGGGASDVGFGGFGARIARGAGPVRGLGWALRGGCPAGTQAGNRPPPAKSAIRTRMEDRIWLVRTRTLTR